jgi:SAM-dependent methyltransferase
MFKGLRRTVREHLSERTRSRLSALAYLVQYYLDGARLRHIRNRPVLAESELALPAAPVGPNRFARRLCKVCDETDWVDEDWLGLLDALGVGEMRERKHRKGWEWAQGTYALGQFGVLRDDAVGLGVGAGAEQVLFYLANRVGMVYATDIYGSGEFAGETAFADMLTHPERYARVPFRPDHLTVLQMDGRKLDFASNTFDFAFSFSSIEHFGGHEASGAAVREIGRVLKPGGVAVLTTELILNNKPHGDYFLPKDLHRYCVLDSGLELIEDIDYTISPRTISHALDCRRPSYRSAAPHIVLRFRDIAWTSICLVLEKARYGG